MQLHEQTSGTRTLTEHQREQVITITRLCDLGAETDWADVVTLGVAHLFEKSGHLAWPTHAARVVASGGELSSPPRTAREIVAEAVDKDVSPQVLARRLGRSVGPGLAHAVMDEERARRAGEPSPAAIAAFFAASRG